jgi:hypothetical protein
LDPEESNPDLGQKLRRYVDQIAGASPSSFSFVGNDFEDVLSEYSGSWARGEPMWINAQ